MAVYSVGVTPLISMLIDIPSNECSANVHAMAYAVDFSAAGNLQDLKKMLECSDRNWSKIWLLSRTKKNVVSS